MNERKNNGDSNSVAKPSTESDQAQSELGTPENADVVAQALVQLFREPFHLDDHDVRVSCSIGQAIFPDHSDNQVTLMRIANEALYGPKQTRNAFHSNSSNTARSTMSGPLVFDAVRRAIDHSHLEVYYQPQADLRTGRLCGLEALVRWCDPSQGLQPTLELIGLAEDSGLIADITDYVCRAALSRFKEWRQRGLASGISLAINVSGSEVRANGIAPMLRRRAAEAGVPLSALEIEITERALMRRDTTATEVLSELRREGVRVSLDDFGTGYSSLARLQRLPVDVLKIDRTFVNRIGCSSKESAVARAVIAIAHSLELTVVAEGVESRDQYNFLCDHDCDLYQGYLLSPALSAEKMSRYLERAQSGPLAPSLSSPKGQSTQAAKGTFEQGIIPTR